MCTGPVRLNPSPAPSRQPSAPRADGTEVAEGWGKGGMKVSQGGEWRASDQPGELGWDQLV